MHRTPSANADFVHGLLVDLERKGFSGAPRFLGIDESGLEILSFIPGEVPSDLGIFADPVLADAARLLRALHVVTSASSLSGHAEIVCHGDVSPCNTVFRAGRPFAFIDFDAAHPGTRLNDLGYAAWLWTDLGNTDISPERQGKRVGIFARAYGELRMNSVTQAILEAQGALATRLEAPRSVREWALTCQEWTSSCRDALTAIASAPTM